MQHFKLPTEDPQHRCLLKKNVRKPQCIDKLEIPHWLPTHNYQCFFCSGAPGCCQGFNRALFFFTHCTIKTVLSRINSKVIAYILEIVQIHHRNLQPLITPTVKNCLLYTEVIEEQLPIYTFKLLLSPTSKYNADIRLYNNNPITACVSSWAESSYPQQHGKQTLFWLQLRSSSELHGSAKWGVDSSWHLQDQQPFHSTGGF